MENAEYTIRDVVVKKLEVKTRPNGEDRRVQVVLEFKEDLKGCRFPVEFNNAVDGSGPDIMPLFRPSHGVLSWKSVEICAPRRLIVVADFNNHFISFPAVLKNIKVVAKWTEQAGDVLTYRLTLEKLPEPTLDGNLGYYLGRKEPQRVTGKLVPCLYSFSITDSGSAVPSIGTTDGAPEN